MHVCAVTCVFVSMSPPPSPHSLLLCLYGSGDRGNKIQGRGWSTAKG